MTWSVSANTATVRWYGFHDSHSSMVAYYVTLNGQMVVVGANSLNDATIYSAVFNNAGLVTGARYRVVIRGVNSGGLSSSAVAVVEAFGNSDLNLLHEVCDTQSLCERQYQVQAATFGRNGCVPAYGSQQASPRTCTCSYSVAYCVDVPVDRSSVTQAQMDAFMLAVADGFQPGVDIDYQVFANALGGTWTVSACVLHHCNDPL